MSFPITSLSSNGTYFTDRYFDEISFTSNKIGPEAVYSNEFDEISLSTSTAKRETNNGKTLVSGYLDEVTGINVQYGASVPWTTYDETNYNSISNSSSIMRNSTGLNFNIYDVSAEATNLACVNLSATNSFIKWISTKSANALTLRYSLSSVLSGTVTLGITGSSVDYYKIPVTNKQSWLYIDTAGTLYISPTANTIPVKRYNESRLLLNNPIQTGDYFEIRINSDDTPIYFDTLETEDAILVSNPDVNFYFNVKNPPFNAQGNGITDDTTSISICLLSAFFSNKNVYIPTGTYMLSAELVCPPNTIIQGAGIWYTNMIFFLTGGESRGGFAGNGSNIKLQDLYLKGSQYNRATGGYHAIKGIWENNSIIRNIWAEQTETGSWIGDFQINPNIATNLIIENCRFRNTFADGVNLAQGTSFSKVNNCHFRGNGDTGLSTWSSGQQRGKPIATGNVFSFNTIENIWRDTGIGVFGGQGHKIYNNLVRNQIAGSGIRFNTLFIYSGSTKTGHNFGSLPIEAYNNTFLNILTGDYSYGFDDGAISLQTSYAGISAINFNNNHVENAHYSAIQFFDFPPQYIPPAGLSARPFSNINFRKTYISNIGSICVSVLSSASGSASFDVPTQQLGVNNKSNSFNIITI